MRKRSFDRHAYVTIVHSLLANFPQLNGMFSSVFILARDSCAGTVLPLCPWFRGTVLPVVSMNSAIETVSIIELS